MCGLASVEGSDNDIFFKCMQMLNSEQIGYDSEYDEYVYEADARDYFELAAEICYLGMLQTPHHTSISSYFWFLTSILSAFFNQDDNDVDTIYTAEEIKGCEDIRDGCIRHDPSGSVIWGVSYEGGCDTSSDLRGDLQKISKVDLNRYARRTSMSVWNINKYKYKYK